MSSEQQPGPGPRARLVKLLRRLRKTELGGLAHDTVWVAVWQGSIAAAGLLQIILVTHAFGIGGYGRLAVVVAFVGLVGGLFNLRVGYAATTYGSRWLMKDTRVAAGVFQYSVVIDTLSTLVALPVLVLLAFTVGPHVAGDGSASMIVVFAFSLVGPAISRMSYVVLRLLDRFALITTYEWALEFGRVGLVFLAIQIFDSLLAVVAAITVGTLIAGAVNLTVAARVYSKTHGVQLLRSHLSTLDAGERKGMRTTMFHTLVIQYSRVVQTQLPAVLLGALAGTTQAGIYKIGTAATAIIGKIIQPASQALLPRISRLWAAGRIFELRKLIFRASAISTVVMVTAFTLIVVFRDPVLHLLGRRARGRGGRHLPDPRHRVAGALRPRLLAQHAAVRRRQHRPDVGGQRRRRRRPDPRAAGPRAALGGRGRGGRARAQPGHGHDLVEHAGAAHAAVGDGHVGRSLGARPGDARIGLNRHGSSADRRR